MNKIANKYTKGNTYYVQSVPLDYYFRNFRKPIHFVKIDVEGAEFNVLKGMQKIIKKNKDIKFQIEFCPHQLKEYGVQPLTFLEFLEEKGFMFYDISSKQNKIKKISKLELINTYESGITNIFCVRK